jgi:hypothetical protein
VGITVGSREVPGEREWSVTRGNILLIVIIGMMIMIIIIIMF